MVDKIDQQNIATKLSFESWLFYIFAGALRTNDVGADIIYGGSFAEVFAKDNGRMVANIWFRDHKLHFDVLEYTKLTAQLLTVILAMEEKARPLFEQELE